jgi:hypothetical protein
MQGRRGIYWKRGLLIVKGVEFSGGSGTWQEVFYMQEEVGHCGTC